METYKFDISDEEFLLLTNNICKKESPIGDIFAPLTSMDEAIDVDHLDSLGVMVFFVWITELFGITEKTFDEFAVKGSFTVTAIKEFVAENATRSGTYADVEEYSNR